MLLREREGRESRTMSRIKRLVAAFVALVVALVAAAPAWAANTGKITITDPIKDVTYSVYKVFDAAASSGTAVTYTIDKSSAWASTLYSVEEDTGVITSKVMGLTFAADPTNNDVYIVTADGTFKAYTFASTLKAVDSKPQAVGTMTSDSPTLSNVAPGYYLVVGSQGDHAMLTTVCAVTQDEEVQITDKNDVPFDKTVKRSSEDTYDDKADIQVGDTLDYKIEAKVPNDISEYETYVYRVADTMSTGLTFKQPVTVKIGDSDVSLTTSENTGASLTGDAIHYTDSGFELSLNLLGMTPGTSIEITYQATVGKDAVAVVTTNNATLTYSNDPTSGGTGTKEEETETYSSKIVIDKYAISSSDTSDHSTKLAGATFRLYKLDTDNTTKLYYHNSNDSITYTSDAETAFTVTTNDTGAANFDGLLDGTYYLEETVAPTGYAKLTSPVEVTVKGESATTESHEALTKTAEVGNNPGSLIPSTGGMGTTIFYIASAAVLAVIVIRVVRHRREA